MNICVKVVLLANFREIVGEKEVVKGISSNSTLRNLLDEFANKYGRDFKQMVNPRTGEISSEFLVSVNGRIARDANVKLNNNDVLILTIPAGGG